MYDELAIIVSPPTLETSIAYKVRRSPRSVWKAWAELALGWEQGRERKMYTYETSIGEGWAQVLFLGPWSGILTKDVTYR